MIHKKAVALAAAFLYGGVMNRNKLFVILLDVGVLVIAMTAHTLTDWMLHMIPACPVATLGLLCPACGGTRCVRYFFSGRFADAFGVNPFFFSLILYLAAAMVLLNVGALLDVKKADQIARGMTNWRAVIVIAVAFAIFGIVRNFW